MKSLGKKIFSIVISINLVLLSYSGVFAQKAFAQAGGAAGGGGNVSAGFNVGGVGSALIGCTGLVDKLSAALNEIFKIGTEVSVSDQALRTKENCLDALSRFVSVAILDKMTLATVKWINSGFEGDPLWVENPEEFFGNIAKQEINKMFRWYPEDPTNYPFGRIVAQAVLLNLQRQTADNLRYSLNEAIGGPSVLYGDFQVDFNVGGWVGYTALFEPNNNPIGNYLLVNQELGRRTAGTYINVAENFNRQLQQSGGFLNQRKCILTNTDDPQDSYIDKENPYYMGDYAPITPSVLDNPVLLADFIDDTYDFWPQAVQDDLITPGLTDLDIAQAFNNFVARSNCKKWETITPGKTIVSQLDKALGSPTDQLLLADEVSEDLALIFDALLNQLIKTGLRELDPNRNSSPQSNVLIAQVQGQQPGQVAAGNVPPPAQDALTGTGSSTIDALNVQYNFIALASDPGGAVETLSEIVTKIRALDYCVPGPNPRWFDLGQDNFNQFMLVQLPFSSNNPNPNDAQQENEDYYADQIFNFTGASIDQGPEMDSFQEFTAFMQNVFSQYAIRMQDVQNGGYSINGAPPAVRPVLNSLLYELPGYEQDLSNVNNYLANINSYLPILSDIVDQINILTQNNGGVLDLNDPNVQAQFSLYDSISSNLVSEAQLNSLQAQMSYYTSQLTLINNHLNSCVNETVVQNYPYPNQRVAYPDPIFPFPGLPGPDTEFLPGVGFGSGGNDIDIEFNGVTVSNPSSDLTTFESILQTVY